MDIEEACRISYAVAAAAPDEIYGKTPSALFRLAEFVQTYPDDPAAIDVLRVLGFARGQGVYVEIETIDCTEEELTASIVRIFEHAPQIYVDISEVLELRQ